MPKWHAAALRSGPVESSRTSWGQLEQTVNTPPLGFIDLANDYGVIPNGPDNTAIFAQAARDAGTAGGGVLYLRPGAYIGSFSIRSSNVWIGGSGSGTVTLKRPPSLADDRNVVEFNQTALGNSAPALTNCGIFGLTVDGNKANVPTPASSGADITNHGVIATNVSRFVVRDLTSQNCWNSGLDLVISCDYFDVDGVFVTDCSNATTGIAGFEMNSSRSGRARVTVQNCVYGVRLLDNLNGSTFDLTIRQTNRHGLILDNQPSNQSTGNTVRAVIHEAGVDGVGAGLQFGKNWDGNHVEAEIAYTGCSYGANILTPFHPTTGVLFGEQGVADADQPQGNEVSLVLYRNGGAGLQGYATQANDLRIVAQENSQQSPLTYYAVDNAGNNQDWQIVCRDGNAKQKGVVHRSGATGNRVTLGALNPTSPYDDASGNASNCVTRTRGGVNERSESTGAVAVDASDMECQRFTAALTGDMTVTFTGTFVKGDLVEIVRSDGSTAHTMTVNTTPAKVIPNSTAATVRARYDGTSLIEVGYSVL